MYTLKKEERLCNKKLLEQLFHKGSSFLCYPYRVSWLSADLQSPFPVQVVFPVSRKRYKHAVKRNLIRRRMREAYRLNKHRLLYDFLTGHQKSIALSLSYIGQEIVAFETMNAKMEKLFTMLCRQIAEKSNA